MSKYALFIGFFLFHINLSAFTYPKYALRSTSSGFWEPVLFSYLIEGLFLYLLLKGLFTFSKEDLIDIFKEMMGKWLARLLLLPFAAYLFIHLTLIPRYHSEMLVISFLPRFPLWSVMLLWGLVFYSASKGPLTFLRASMLFSIVIIPLILFSIASSIQNWNYHYVFPLVNMKMDFLSNGDYYSGMISFLPFLFLGMIPVGNFPALQKSRYMVWTYACLLPFHLLSIYNPILTFGQKAASKLQYPMLAVMDSVDIAWLMFDRLTLFYVVASLMGSFLYTSLAAWMFVKLIQKLYVPLNSRWITGLLMIAVLVCGLLIPNLDWLQNLERFLSAIYLYCMIAIPATVFILSKFGRRSPA
ncbi:GerAB/ArcD/ProY family transporter [Paenibacillus sp. LMG 31456]|uniref:GerAB/ArcD/ProY family transporter n=1 Tax=Paenibacillus foliorum TaxID=2654974 RepID=A0A972GU87_9BACL|nr:GerAB/ArcD/ProY family transporter [Paenibacillus foliorum]NOU96433.1 GerAB/ArcD/ProY family transporter [Paenibacillus foliorum]